MWWGGASSRRAPSSMPVGYASQTGYQYDSISRVAGQREPAPPSKFSNEGGFKNSVFRGIWVVFILTDATAFSLAPGCYLRSIFGQDLPDKLSAFNLLAAFAEGNRGPLNAGFIAVNWEMRGWAGRGLRAGTCTAPIPTVSYCFRGPIFPSLPWSAGV